MTPDLELTAPPRRRSLTEAMGLDHAEIAALRARVQRLARREEQR